MKAGPRRGDRKIQGGCRIVLFEEVPPSTNAPVRFRYPVRAQSATFIGVGGLFLLIGLWFAFFKPQFFDGAKLFAVMGLTFGAGGILLGIWLLWAHQVMEIDGHARSLNLIIRTPIGERTVRYGFHMMRSIQAWPVSTEDGNTNYHVGIEMNDNWFLELGQGPKARAEILARRVGGLTGLEVHIESCPSAS